jgi:ligand-binding sensor domain-containing protein
MDRQLLGDTVLTVEFGPDQTIFVGGPAGGFHSSDQGNTWERLAGIAEKAVVTTYCIAGTETMYLGTREGYVYRWDSYRSTWQQMGSELPGGSIRQILFDSYGRLIVCAQGNVLITENDGTTWVDVTSLMPGTYVNALLEDGPDRILIATDSGLFVSRRIGDPAVPVAGLYGVPVYSLTVNSKGYFYAGTDKDVYASFDEGRSWTPSGVYWGARVQTIAVNPSTSWIFIGTMGSGVYYSYPYVNGLTSFDNDRVETAGTSLAITPNPFASRTVISFSLERTSDVHLDIYSSDGRRIETLVDSRLEAGAHRIEWTADGLPGGAYMYRLRIGEEVASGMVMVQR